MSDPLSRFDVRIHGDAGRPLAELAGAFDRLENLSTTENHRIRQALVKPGFREALAELAAPPAPVVPEAPPPPAAQVDALDMSDAEYLLWRQRGFQ